MACRVNRNNDNKIIGVTTENGIKSELFEKIHSNIFGADAETSLNIYGVSEKSDISSLYEGVTDSDFVYEKTGEPKLYYKFDTGNIIENLETGILSDATGFVEAGFLNPNNGEFIKAYSFNMDASNTSKVLKGQVKSGFISAERVLTEAGDTRFKGKGELKSSIKGTAEFAKQNIEDLIGESVELFEDGTFTINSISPFIEVKTSNGKIEVMSLSEASARLKDSPDSVSNKAEVIIATTDLLNAQLPLNKDSKPTENNFNGLSYKAYVKQLNGFLEGLGFTVETLDNYKKAYAERNNTGIEAEGLIDLANKVIALTNEGLTKDKVVEVFTEEVAHLAVETYSDQVGVSRALLEVAETELYKEWAETYRNKYSRNYKGEELESVVRKEILGKLVAKEVLNPTVIESDNVFRRIWDFFTSRINDYIKPSHARVLNKLTKDIANSIKNNDVNSFSNEISQGVGTLYSLPKAEKEATKKTITDTIRDHHKMNVTLANAVKENNLIMKTSNSPEMLNLLEDASDIDVMTAIGEITRVVRSNTKFVEKSIDEAKKGDKTNKMSVAMAFEHMRENFETASSRYTVFLKEARERIPQNIDIVNTYLNDINTASSQMSELSGKIDIIKEEGYQEILEQYAESTNMPEAEKVKFYDLANAQKKDVGWMMRVFGLTPESSQFNLGFISRIMSEMNADVNYEAIQKGSPLVDDYMKRNLNKSEAQQVQKDADGKDSHYIHSAFDYPAWEKGWNDFNVEKIHELTGISKEAIQKDINSSRKPPADYTGDRLIEDEAKLKEYDKAKEERKEKTDASYLSQEQKEQIRLKEDRANVSEETKNEIRGERRNLLSIRRNSKAFDKNTGRLDMTKMTESEKTQLEDEKMSLEIKKSATDATGEFYHGITTLNWSEMSEDQKQMIPQGIRDIEGFDEYMATHKGKLKVMDGSEAYENLGNQAKYVIDKENMRIGSMIDRFSTDKGNRVEAKVSSDFLAEFKRLEEIDPNLAYDYAVANGSLKYTDEYYEGLDLEGGYLNLAQQAIDALEESDPKKQRQQEVIDRIKYLNKQRAEIIKPYYSERDSDEPMGRHMTSPIKNKIKEIESEAQDLRQSLITVENTDGKPSTIETISDVTSDFYAEMREAGQNVYGFATSHMTERNKGRTAEFKNYLAGRMLRGNSEVKDSFDEAINRIVYEKNNVQAEEIKRQLHTISESNMSEAQLHKAREVLVDLIANEYAKEKVLPYYKKYELKGKEELLHQMRQGKERGGIDLYKLIKDGYDKYEGELPLAAKYLKIRPDYNWLENENVQIDPNNKYRREFGVSQPNYDMYKKDMREQFGFTNEEWFSYMDGEIADLKATKNQDAWEGIKINLKLRKEANAQYGSKSETDNLFERPQQSTTGYEKIRDINRAKSSAKDLVRDLIQDRADEKDYGEYQTSAMAKYNMKQPPKMYRNRLESPDLLSKNMMTVYAQDMYEAIRYKHRVKAIPKVELILDKIAKTEYTKTLTKKRTSEGNITTGQVSNTYLTAREKVDASIYGIKQNLRMEIDVMGNTIDLTRMVSGFQGISSTLNLRLSPLIETTSRVVGGYQVMMERLAENYLSRDSYNKSFYVRNSDMHKSISDVGKTNPSSRYVQLMQFLNMRTFDEQIQESRASRAGRYGKDFNSALTSLADHPVRNEVIYATLFDNRFVPNKNGKGGRFYTYREFEAMKEASDPGIKKKQIKSAWKNNKDFYFNYLETSDGGIKYSKSFAEKFENTESADAEFARTRRTATTTSKQMMQEANGVIDVDSTPMAKRNVILNTMLQHQGWLPINMMRMFKGRGHNFMTGKMDEGKYRTAFRLVNDIISDSAKRKDLLKITQYKEVWNSLSRDEKRNIRRMYFEMMGYSAALLLLFGLKTDRDPDNSWFQQYSELIALRSFQQIKGNHPLGVVPSVRGIIESPVVSYRTLEDMTTAIGNLGKKDWTEKDKQKALDIIVPGKKSFRQAANPYESMNSWLIYQDDILPEWLLNND